MGMKPRTRLEALRTKLTYEPNTGCWLFMGEITGNGYGRLHFEGKRALAHRCAYEEWTGPIPDGLEIDHLCNVRSCCNPKHLRTATRTENNIRRLENITHCNNGHEFTQENTYVDPRGWRQCKICRRERIRKHNNGSAGASNANKTHCQNGHAFDTIDASGRRRCKTCDRNRERKNQQRF